MEFILRETQIKDIIWAPGPRWRGHPRDEGCGDSGGEDQTGKRRQKASVGQKYGKVREGRPSFDSDGPDRRTGPGRLWREKAIERTCRNGQDESHPKL